MENKKNDSHAELSTGINEVKENVEQLAINNTAKSRNRSNHIASQQEALNDEIKHVQEIDDQNHAISAC